MKSINHPQARRLIHARLDGILKHADSTRLSAHLQTCNACRQYAAQIQSLDSGLRQEFYIRRLSAPAIPARAFDAIPHHVVQSRAKMNTNRIFASSLTFALLLILLAGGLSVLFSNRSILSVLAPPAPLRQPASELLPTSRPTPASTSTPLPAWTIDAPLTSSAAILTYLQGLSQKNLELLRSTGWLHTTRRDLGQEGTIPTNFSESWARAPQQGEEFPQMLTIVKAQPGGESLLQLNICLADGACGDLVALRQGNGAVEHLNAVPEVTIAGLLARRLAGNSSLSKNGAVDRSYAWIETLDGKPAFVVSLHYTPQQPSPTTPETTEIYSFDLETGLALRENVRMVYPNGAPFGETLVAYQHEFLPELPADVAGQVTSTSAELRSFAASTSVAAISTVTSLPASALSALDDPPYTREDPLTDGQKIQELLVALRQRLSTWLSRPGWYVFDPMLPHDQNWVSSRSTALQVIDSAGTCQAMVYYLKDGQILPNEVTLADGAWGLIGDVQAGIFTEAEASHPPCRLYQVDHLASIYNEINFFRDFAAGKLDGEYRLWVETIDIRPVLILSYDIRYSSPKPVTMDPDTRKLEPEDRSVKQLYFDLETGAILGQYEQVTLENGKTFGEKYQEGDPLPLGIHSYESLPAELMQAFEKATQDLHTYLESITP
jgi:hypothetical protein